jgi:hypothetical protein
MRFDPEFSGWLPEEGVLIIVPLCCPSRELLGVVTVVV